MYIALPFEDCLSDSYLPGLITHSHRHELRVMGLSVSDTDPGSMLVSFQCSLPNTPSLSPTCGHGHAEPGGH